MVYHINEGIQYCISLCICLLSVLQVFNEGDSVRKEKRGERASPGGRAAGRRGESSFVHHSDWCWPHSGWYLLRWQGHDSELMLRHSEDTGTGLVHFVGVGRWQEAQEGVRVRRQNVGNLG